MLYHLEFAQSEVEAHRKWLMVQADHWWHTLLLPSSNLHHGKKVHELLFKKQQRHQRGRGKKAKERKRWMAQGEQMKDEEDVKRWEDEMKQRQTNEVWRGTKDERGTPKVASERDGAVRGGMMKDGRRELVWKWGDGWHRPSSCLWWAQQSNRANSCVPFP